MEGKKKTYWKGIEQLTNDSEFVKYAEKEFPENLPINDTFGDNSSGGTSRRDFLKMMGFSVAAVSLAACETPIKKAIPYLNKPENVDPGIPNYYASTYLDGSDYCSVVVKTREGRPIFVQGNEFSKVTFGGTSARANASIMSLYDIEKAQFASKKGQKIDWKTADQEIIKELANVASSGKDIRIVANTLMSPSTKLAINQFIAKYPTAKLVMYDQISASGMLEANNKYFGKSVLPSYSFDKASTIVSIGADFLGAWISPVEFNKQFSKTRKVGKDRKEMSRLYAFETLMTITGGAADYRNTYKPSQEGLVVANLYNLIAEKAGKNKITAAEVKLDKLKKAADDLWASKGKSLVVAGSNDTNVQLIVNAINEMLESYGNTINMSVPLFTKQGSDSDMDQLIKDVTGSKIGAIIFYNANPVYDHPLGGVLATSLKNVALTISTADRLEETAELCTYNTPDSHFLESWNDAEPKLGHFSLGQPTITTIFETRQTQQSLLVWASSEKTYLDIIKEYWKELFKLQNKETEFEVFWKTSLHHGVFQPAISASFLSVHLGGGAVKAVSMPVEDPKKEDAKKVEVKKEEPKKEEVKPVVSSSNFDVTSVDLSKYKANNEGIELVIYEKSIVGSGSQANNPFLHETPDPISKACWGNYISVSQITSREKGFVTKEGKTNVAKVKINGQEIVLPVLVQPGQAAGTVGIALGFGRTKAGKVATEAGGVSMYPFLKLDGTVKNTQFANVELASADETVKFAQTQTHQTFMGRESIIQETTLAEYQKDDLAGRYMPKISTSKGLVSPQDISMWDVSSDSYPKEKPAPKTDYEKNLWSSRNGDDSDIHKYPIHHWGMVIDLNTCTGCSACVVACHTENNVPIVGKQEIINRREMHWLRIDRYYSSEGAPKDYAALEIASDSPEVIFQPLMCQHCNNAPCETVCPVAATTHSTEGLNQMTYNRCVGTKYCANNCPYKVRRFNWFKYFNNDEFDYHLNNDLGKMVLNPDVTVRSRGVMEKCSLCVQRIQSGKLKAKSEKRTVNDGDVITACASACPSDAITFGDLNNPLSKISTLLNHEIKSRAYNILDEVGTKPNVWYLTKVRNKDQEKA